MEIREDIRLTDHDAFAIYRLPGEEDYNLIQGSLSQGIPEESAFIVQRFDKQGKNPLFIKCEKRYINATFTLNINEKCTESQTHISDYLDIAETTINALKSKVFEKVVLSKLLVVNRNDDNLYRLFMSLIQTYHNAFVFIYNIPGEGCWCGATPEILLKKEKNDYVTMALAGTQLDKGINKNEVMWGEKEIQEQAIIESYIKSKLDVLNISYKKEGPYTVKAGHVLHILSVFRCEKIDDPLYVADDLHPGPAICGMPPEESLKWIKNHELHERQHYCGYLGPWDIQNNRSLYINLRSMRIYIDKYVLYVGGGLTTDSKPSAEWEETEMKAQTLLSIIQKAVVV